MKNTMNDLPLADSGKTAKFGSPELKAACFSGDTPVLAEGYEGEVAFIAIEHIEVGFREYGKVGFRVLSRNEITGEMAFKRVVKFYKNDFDFRKTCFVFYGGPNIKRIFHRDTLMLDVTPEHPFWVQGKGWTPACDLKPGDEFLSYDSSPVTVDRVECPEHKALVFNLEVEDFNTYFVGGMGIWVHNCNNMDPRKPTKARIG
jgi:intein/homing endonuclease